MARTTLALQNIGKTGLKPVLTAANVDGHKIPIQAHTFVRVNNGSATSINVTVKASALVDGLPVTDRVVAVPASEERDIALDAAVYNQADDTRWVDFSAVTTVTVAALMVE